MCDGLRSSLFIKINGRCNLTRDRHKKIGDGSYH